jgi:HK97 family phage major capsid protein
MAYAQSQNWPNAREVVESLRRHEMVKMAAVSPIGTSDYALPTPAAFDFADFIRPLTIIGRLPGLRRVPSRTRLIAATSGSSAYWSGERNPRPISRATFAGSTLEPLSVIATLVVTRELLTSSTPDAESVLSRDLAAATVQAMDQAFIDPSNAGIAGVMPASITSGVTKIHSSGSTLAAIDNDLPILVQAAADAGSDLVYGAWVMRPRTWLFLKQLRGTSGAPAFPGLTSVRGGGELLGFPVIVSAASPSDVGSPAEGGDITFLDASQILVADDGASAFEVSTQTSLAMADNPTAPSTVVSMFQTESAALKITRYANWQRCRNGMAQVLDQVAY